MTTIVAGINVDRVWTGDEILDLHAKGKLRDVALQGYCTRADADGTLRFVPFYESTWFRSDEQKMVTQSVDIGTAMKADLDANHPIIRRTPQDRVASMFLRLLTTYKQTGSLAGVPTEVIKKIAGNAWREGQPLTDEVIRGVAAHYLGIGEVDNKAAKQPHAIKDRVPEVG